jgi:hypothetical protein
MMIMLMLATLFAIILSSDCLATVKTGDPGEGDKICWMVESKEMILSESTIRMIKLLKYRVENELRMLGNGELKEIEFEFQNKIELAFHFVNNETSFG